MPATKRNIDFSKVKDASFRPKHVPEGQYYMQIVKVEDYESKAGNDQWLFTFKIAKGHGKGATYPYYCSLESESAWKIRNIIEGVGATVPKKLINTDPNKLVGKFCWVEMEDDEYEGKAKSVIARVLKPDEVDAAADADEADEEVGEDEPKRKPKPKADEGDAEAPKGKKKDKKDKKKKPAPTVADDELEELDIDEL